MKNAMPILLLLLLLAAPHARAQDSLYAQVEVREVYVCDSTTRAGVIPDFKSSACIRAEGQFISPYKRHIWVVATLIAPRVMAESQQPLGFFLSAKASSTLWLNGSKLGSNGLPARTRDHEVPGKMDTAFALPPNALKAGKNDVIIEMSGHHSIIPLLAPVHLIAVARYQSPTDNILRGYLPSLLPLGVLLLGAMYFGVSALRMGGGQRFLVPLTAFFAAGQLVSEVSRGLFAYEYPFHDIRLMLILGFATGTGACLFLHVLARFVRKRRFTIALFACLAYLGLVLPAEGFDTKTSLALLLPSMLAALISGYGLARRRRGAVPYTLVLFFFTGLIYLAPTRFLDIYFYYCVAALLVFLFAQELRSLFKERRMRAAEKARADQLELALSESQERENPSNVQLSSAGKVEILPTADIAYARGAGDYVELVLKDRTTRLHSATLSELESRLPGKFLRVHRSYLVNTAYIVALERDASGAGSLDLTIGETVPVSRRIMPSVRKALT